MELIMSDIKGLAVYDNPNTGFAHNIYQDEDGGTVYIERVWNNAGVTVVSSNGDVRTISLKEFKAIRNG